MTQQQFLDKYYPLAVQATAGTTLLPATLITQLIGESGYTLSKLASDYNNFFGLKSGSGWNGKVVSMTTAEYKPDGTKYYLTGTGKLYNNKIEATTSGANVGTLFRVYPTVVDGFKGWVNFLSGYSRYKKVFEAKTPTDQFAELQKAGYATSPTYSSYLASIYDQIKNKFPIIAASSGVGLIAIIAIFFFLKNKK
jgi:flagellum-specific peptidoglycan hydrolase FlgJ